MIDTLIYEIFKLFIILFLGFLLVKVKLLKKEDSRVLSLLVLYLITPCVVISTFAVEFSRERVYGMLLALFASTLINTVFILLTMLLRKPLQLNRVEQGSAIYAGNLVVPLIISVLGKEAFLYGSMFVVVQQFFFWSHLRSLMSGESSISLRKILLNINIISAFVGALLFFFRIPLPGALAETMDTISSMVGPICMLVAGMLMSDIKPRELLAHKGLYKTTVLRLIVYPLVAMVILKLSGLGGLIPGGEEIILVVQLAVTTATAISVTQMAEVYGGEGPYASAINVVTTLCSIITLPAIMALFERW